MVTIPLKQTFLNLQNNRITEDGKPAIGDVNVKTGKPYDEKECSKAVTLRDSMIVALTTEFKEDSDDHANIVSNKLTRFALFQKFNDTTPETESMVLTPEEAVYLKPRVARCFGVLVCGPILKLLG